jgi:ribosome recycling factor
MIKIPPMTEERRKDIVKLLKKELEESKIKVRNLRHEILKEIKFEFDEKEISEDEKK